MRWVVAGSQVVVAGLACVAMAYGWFVTGGVLMLGVALLQLVARREYGTAGSMWALASSTSAFYGLALAIGGASIYTVRHQDYEHPELAGAAALTGAVVAGYMSARVGASLGPEVGTRGLVGLLAILARSEVLLIVLAAGAVLEQSFIALWAAAGLSALSATGRLTVLRFTMAKA